MLGEVQAATLLPVWPDRCAGYQGGLYQYQPPGLPGLHTGQKTG